MTPPKIHRLPGAARIRLTFDVSDELNRMMEHAASALDTSKAEVLRKAIALMDVAVEAKQRGHSLALVDEGGAIVSRIVGV